MKIALAVFCFWVSSLCLGQQTAADYEISGTVVDANSGVPLSQSDVTVTPAATRTGGQTQTTHEGGHFHFEHLPAGKYALCAARQGYLPQCFNQHDDFSTAIVVGPGVDSEPLVFRLEHSARVIGTITDPNRDPISNAMVYLIRKGVARSGPGRMNQKSTNDLGKFKFTVAPGDYYLAVSAQPWFAQIIPQQPQNSLSSSTSSEFDVAYPVSFYPSGTQPEEASAIHLEPGAEVSADMMLTAVPAAHLFVDRPSGSNLNSGNISMPTPWGFTIPIGSRTWHRDEGIEISGVAPGHYQMNLFWFDGNQGHSFSKEVTVSGNTTIDGSIQNGAPVTAIVEWPVPHPPSGQVLALHNNHQTLFAQQQETGQFVFKPGVPAGKYELMMAADSFYVASFTVTGAKKSGNWVTIADSEPVTLHVSVGYGMGLLNGTAKKDGHGVAGAMILLLPKDLSQQALIRRDQSDSDGTFTLPQVIPGDYTLLAIDNGADLNYTEPGEISPYIAKGQTIHIDAGDKKELVIPLIPRFSGEPAAADSQ